MKGGEFAPLTIMNSEDTDMNTMITTFNTAVTETASEILGKHRQKKKTWVTAPEASENYKEVNNNIKKCMKKAKENWIEQCNEIGESLRKNNSKRAYQLMKDLTTMKQRLVS